MIKIIALVTMLIDHIGVVFFPEYTVLRIIGRIAMPLFAFCIARGFFYTKSKGKYFTFMIIFAVISQIPFHFMRLLGRGVVIPLEDMPYQMIAAFRLDAHYNILVTWLLALLFLWGLERLLSNKFEWLLFTSALLIGPIAASFYLSFDFGLYGVILPGIFYLTFYGRSVAHKTPKKEVSFRAFDYINAFIFVAIATFLLWSRGSIQHYAVLAVPLIPLLISFDRKIKLPKLLFYFSYPVHIIVLVAIALAIQ
jgi:hypothetical protein